MVAGAASREHGWEGTGPSMPSSLLDLPGAGRPRRGDDRAVVREPVRLRPARRNRGRLRGAAAPVGVRPLVVTRPAGPRDVMLITVHLTPKAAAAPGADAAGAGEPRRFAETSAGILRPG